MKKVLFISLLAFAGCINVTRHAANGPKVTDTYSATSHSYNNYVKAWSDNEFQRRNPKMNLCAKIFYPLFLLDFCGEIICDTLTYPNDLNNYLEYEETMKKFNERQHNYHYNY